MADRYTLTAGGVRTIRADHEILRGGSTSSRPVPTRRRRGGGGSCKNFLRIKGLVKEAAGVSAIDGSFDIDNIEICNGKDPRDDPTSSSETLEILNEPPCVFDDDAVVYAVYDKTEALLWAAADAGNFLAHLKGVGSYDDTKKMAIWINASDNPEWKELASAEQVV